MAEKAVKLFGVGRSPFSRRVEIALKIKGIEYEYIEEDLSNKSPLLLNYNPIHKKVPVLVHNGKPIAESAVILEYIDETWKHNPILPQAPYEKAMARFWAKYLDEKCMMPLWMACWSEGQEQENHMKEAWENLKTLETALQGNKFFGGDTIGMVDIMANYVAYWVGVIQEVAGVSLIDGEKQPILCKWIEDFLSISVVKENLPQREKLHDFFIANKETFSAAKRS